MSNQSSLNSLEREIIAHKVCDNLATQATQLVMGDGNPSAKIVLIGEAPGKSEDLAGLPFVGASGKFLNAMLSAAGLNRGDVYITNIVKYRPPNNRDPSPQEKADFWPYLLRQLEIINPKVVITLGRHSGSYFIPGMHIASDHGVARMIALGGREYLVIPLYHPAAALYNGSMRQTLIDDFTSAVALAQKNTQA